MTTQRRTWKTTLASALVGVAIAILCAGGAWLANSAGANGFGAGWGVLPGAPSQQVSAETHAVTDSVGRTLEVPLLPRHIAAADAFSGNVCVLVGAGERLFGAPGGVKSNVLLQRLDPQLADAAQLSGNSLNAEELLSSGVDVVLVRRSFYDGGKGTAQLERLGIAYVVVDYGTVDEQIEAIRLVGAVCGGECEAKAEAIVAYYRDTVQLVEQRAALVPDSERIRVYHSINDPLLTDGEGSLGADWIARMGAVDVSAQEPGVGSQRDYTATLEQVYAWNPDFVVCSTAAGRAQVQSDGQWAGLSAVAAGNVRNLPVSTSRWGQRGDPETFLGMLWLGKELYPSWYEDVDVEQVTRAYYRDVVGLEIDDATWDAIVAGVGLRTEGSGSQSDP